MNFKKVDRIRYAKIRVELNVGATRRESTEM